MSDGYGLEDDLEAKRLDVGITIVDISYVDLRSGDFEAIFNLETSDDVNSYFQSPTGFVFLILVICAALFGSNLLLTDFHSKTGYLIFTNPSARINFWLGKFIAAQSISILLVSIFYVVLSFGSLYQFQSLSFEVGTSFLFSILVLTTLMSIAFLVSSVFRGPTGASVFFFVLFILILPIIDFIMVGIVDIVPLYSIVFASKIINLVFTDQYSQITNGLVFSGFDYAKIFPNTYNSIIILFGYVIGTSALSIFFYTKKEMK